MNRPVGPGRYRVLAVGQGDEWVPEPRNCCSNRYRVVGMNLISGLSDNLIFSLSIVCCHCVSLLGKQNKNTLAKIKHI